MKRKSFRNRVRAFPTPFVRPVTGRQLDRAQTFSANGQRRSQMRKIFVVKQVRRPFESRSGQALPATNAAGKKVQHILIFDNHPDSLRLVFGLGASSWVDLSDRQHGSSWALVMVRILALIALIGMFWPLF